LQANDKRSSDIADIDKRSISGEVSVSCGLTSVQQMNHVLPTERPSHAGLRSHSHRTTIADVLDEFRLAPDSQVTLEFTIIPHEHSVRRLAKVNRLVEHRFEDWGEVARRSVDDLQDLGGGGLVLQCLARLGQQPRIFDRNHCLRREVLE